MHGQRAAAHADDRKRPLEHVFHRCRGVDAERDGDLRVVGLRMVFVELMPLGVEQHRPCAVLAHNEPDGVLPFRHAFIANGDLSVCLEKRGPVGAGCPHFAPLDDLRAENGPSLAGARPRVREPNGGTVHGLREALQLARSDLGCGARGHREERTDDHQSDGTQAMQQHGQTQWSGGMERFDVVDSVAPRQVLRARRQQQTTRGTRVGSTSASLPSCQFDATLAFGVLSR